MITEFKFAHFGYIHESCANEPRIFSDREETRSECVGICLRVGSESLSLTKNKRPRRIRRGPLSTGNPQSL
jgi:hypothetical protein